MPDDGAVAVLETPGADVNADSSQGESNQLTPDKGTDGINKTDLTDKQDGRKQPDALRKRVAELRRQADSITDPVAKDALLKDAKALNDTIGKARAYEEQFNTVREVREVKALLTSIAEQTGAKDWREGIGKMQATISDVAQVDAQLAAGDPAAAKRIWDEAPDGMPKIMPALLTRFEQEKPQDYAKFIAPHSIKFLDSSGFPQAFDNMVRLYESGKTDEAKALKAELTQWVVGNRTAAQQQQEQRVDPEVERLRAELAKRDTGAESKAVDTAYSAATEHGGKVISTALASIVGKLGLTKDQTFRLANYAWDNLQTARNADPTYKTVAPAKQRLGYDKWTEYANQWASDNAEHFARKAAQEWYGHQLKNGAVSTTNAVKPPGTPGVTAGKQPTPAEIDYGPKGIAAAKKAGFRDLADMLMARQAPLKVGGVRKWQ